MPTKGIAKITFYFVTAKYYYIYRKNPPFFNPRRNVVFLAYYR